MSTVSGRELPVRFPGTRYAYTDKNGIGPQGVRVVLLESIQGPDEIVREQYQSIVRELGKIGSELVGSTEGKLSPSSEMLVFRGIHRFSVPTIEVLGTRKIETALTDLDGTVYVRYENSVFAQLGVVDENDIGVTFEPEPNEGQSRLYIHNLNPDRRHPQDRTAGLRPDTLTVAIAPLQGYGYR